jgi:cytochrome P450
MDVVQDLAPPEAVPTSPIDLYTDEALLDPYPLYRQLRDVGSAVYLSRIDAFFVGRYQDVRSILADWQSFTSTQGIGLNPIINEAWKEALICQDPPVHTERRKLMAAVLSPAALQPAEAMLEQRAAAVAERIAGMGEFDGVADVAHDLPINVVMDLIGWPGEIRPQVLKIADGSWNAAGPISERTEEGLATLRQMMELIADIYDSSRVVPGGFAAQLIDAAHERVITRETAIGMLAGYIVAAFETTISAMASGLWQFARHPDQWVKLRADPRLAVNAPNEIVRLESPLQKFTRVATRDVQLSDGSMLPRGARVIVCYGSANRDERVFAHPDAFIIDRPEKQQLGFGHGPHGCLGQGLARMELVALFRALSGKVERLELAGPAERLINNVASGFARLPMRAVAG